MIDVGAALALKTIDFELFAGLGNG